ncbi:ABC transporter permease [Microbacterium sp. NPDC055910]|uniref:ABC transporter permease n=1 Tax=Microbacterium sp. NPDC055910 TaxID=3345659 RepID=UPI0035DB6D31
MPASEQTRSGSRDRRRRVDWHGALRAATTGSAMIAVLSIVVALFIGAVLIAATNDDVIAASAYFFGRPMDMLVAIWEAVTGAYGALFRGSVINFSAPDFPSAIKPLTDTLTFATPLIIAGLGVAMAFRAGLFNIGGRGQMLIAAGAAGWVGFTLDLPWGLHMLAAVVAGIIGGALWGGLVGLLKARTGAHEVITTIMLNYVAFYLISYLLRTPLLQAPGQNNAKSPPIDDTAVFPLLLGDRYNLHFGFVLAVVVTIGGAWLINRSSIGFRFRAVGFNPHAARVAGIDVGRTYVLAMLVSGGLLGLAGASQVLGTNTSGFTGGVDAGIGFDAIIVALLGRSRPWGVFAAGILFGAFKAGGFVMQASEGVSADIVVVVQAIIVLLIAAPPLVRAIFHLPQPSTTFAKGAVS